MFALPSFSARFRFAVRVRQSRGFVPCACCSVPGRAALGFCLSCGWVQPVLRLLPVLLFAGLVLSSCSRQVVAPAQVPCVVEVQEFEGLYLFSGVPVSASVSEPGRVWFQFQCQFPAWVGSVFAGSVCQREAFLGSESSCFSSEGGFSCQQRGGVWGFWVPVRSLPLGWQRVQWVAQGQVGAR